MNLLSHKNTVAMAALLVALPLAASAQVVFEEDFNGPNNVGLWPAGEPRFGRLNDEGVFRTDLSNPQTSDVAGVDLSAEGITTDFEMSVDVRMTSNVFFGLWFQGANSGSAGAGVAQDGYAIRIRGGDGLFQGLNFVSGDTVNTGGWSSAPNLPSFDITGATDYRLEVVASLDTDGTTGLYDVTVTNLDTNTVVGTNQFTRNNAFINPATGDYFGLFASGSAARYDNFSVAIPEPSSFGLLVGGLAFSAILARRRSKRA